MKYKIDYNLKGQPGGIRREDGASIPLDKTNRDFRKFLEWNKKHKLDWEKSIKVEQPAPVESMEEMIRRIVKEELKK